MWEWDERLRTAFFLLMEGMAGRLQACKAVVSVIDSLPSILLLRHLFGSPIAAAAFSIHVHKMWRCNFMPEYIIPPYIRY